MPIKTYKKLKQLYYILLQKENLEISYQNGPKHETTFHVKKESTSDLLAHFIRSLVILHCKKRPLCGYLAAKRRNPPGDKAVPFQKILTGDCSWENYRIVVNNQIL